MSALYRLSRSGIWDKLERLELFSGYCGHSLNQFIKALRNLVQRSPGLRFLTIESEVQKSYTYYRPVLGHTWVYQTGKAERDQACKSDPIPG